MIWLFLSLIAFSKADLPSSYTKKADETPNICQTCYPKIIRWGGEPHCGPAALSNSLVWLAKNGYPALQPFHDSSPEFAQAQLVNHLGEVMGTTKNGGTSPRQILKGLKTYLDIKQVPFKRIASVGWRGIPDFVVSDGNVVSLDWIKQGILEKGAVWILIGWCKQNSANNNCEIFAGHWMTVVGFGKDRAGKEDPAILIVHDPAERAERINYYPKLIALDKGTIDGNRSAKGVFKLTGDVVTKPTSDFGIIQGAYRLEL